MDGNVTKFITASGGGFITFGSDSTRLVPGLVYPPVDVQGRAFNPLGVYLLNVTSHVIEAVSVRNHTVIDSFGPAAISDDGSAVVYQDRDTHRLHYWSRLTKDRSMATSQEIS